MQHASYDGISTNMGDVNRVLNNTTTITVNDAPYANSIYDNNFQPIPEVPNDQAFWIYLSNSSRNYQVKIENAYNTYTGRVFLGDSKNFQDMCIITGKQNRHTSSVTYDIQGDEIEVNKYILKVGDTKITGNGISTSRNTETYTMDYKRNNPINIKKPISDLNKVDVQYEIRIANTGTEKVKLTNLKDTYDTFNLGRINYFTFSDENDINMNVYDLDSSTFKYRVQPNLEYYNDINERGYRLNDIELAGREVLYIQITLTVDSDTQLKVYENKISVESNQKLYEDADYIHVTNNNDNNDGLIVKKYITETNINNQRNVIAGRKSLTDKENSPVDINMPNEDGYNTVTYQLEITNSSTETLVINHIEDTYLTRTNLEKYNFYLDYATNDAFYKYTQTGQKEKIDFYLDVKWIHGRE